MLSLKKRLIKREKTSFSTNPLIKNKISQLKKGMD